MDLGMMGKVAMVGGSSKGLGFAVARALAAEGVRVSLVSRDESAMKSAADRIRSETNAEVMTVAADLAEAGGCEEWCQKTVYHFGGVDLLYAGTGGPPAGGFLGLDDGAWQAGFSLLVLSAIRLARFAIPVMKSRGGGSILFSTSSSVKEPIPNLTLSNVLRGSVAALAKSLAREFAADRIRINQIIPGRIDTDRVRGLDSINAKKAAISVEEQKTRSLASIPMGRYGETDEFARAAVFLLSGAASYVTGATLQVDGGMIHSVV